MSEVKNLFQKEELAAVYKAFRPDMAPETAKKIIDFLAEKFNPRECDAIDVGCGSGQGTLPLAPFLHQIVGLDPSEAQINKIKADKNIPDNVDFRVGDAEQLPFGDSSLHLVNVKSALHWFDIPTFFEEVDRVLKPGGILAVSCGAGFSNIAGHEDEVKELLKGLGEEYRTSEWTAKTQLVFDGYRDVIFPYEECVRDESVIQEQTITVRNIMNMMKTRSDMALFIADKPDVAEKVLRETEEKLMKIVGASGSPEVTTVLRRSKQTLILCRKPQSTSEQ